MSEINLSDIKIRRRFRTEQGDISRLKASIEDVGLLHPIVISEDKELIAGFRRIQAFKELGRDSIPFHMVNLKELSKGEIQENAVRKDFTVSEMVAVKRALEPEMQREAEERKKTGKPSSKLDAGRTDEKIAKYLGVGKDTLRKAEALVVAAEKAPEKFAPILKKVDMGKRTISNVASEVETWNSKQNAIAIAIPKEAKIEIHHAPFQMVKLAPNSIDLVFTDPPYGEQFVNLWPDLGKEAERILKPDGYLIAYAGQAYLDEKMAALSESLSYEWMIALTIKNSHNRHLDYYGEWKPIVVYRKQPKTHRTPERPMIADLIDSPKAEKRFHEWGQSVEPAIKLIEHFTDPGATIFEPFAGGGSTIQACIETKRNCIAYEINPETFQILKKRFPEAKFD